MAKFNEQGQQIPDDTPVEIPVGFHQPEPLEVTIARLVRLESNRAAETGTTETFEESDDFDTGDDNPTSPYEMKEMIEERPDLAKSLDRPGAPIIPAGIKKETWEEFQAYKAYKEAEQAVKNKAAEEPQQ